MLRLLRNKPVIVIKAVLISCNWNGVNTVEYISKRSKSGDEDQLLNYRNDITGNIERYFIRKEHCATLDNFQRFMGGHIRNNSQNGCNVNEHS